LAFDEGLAARIREATDDAPDISERKMFGGLCFMANGNMCVGIVGSDLMVRVGPDAYEDALAAPCARVMDFNGRPMRGMVYVSPDGVSDDAELAEWVGRGLVFARSLPPK
jgi:TfoX/Sxy family transcriptional regulator of competence genes